MHATVYLCLWTALTLVDQKVAQGYNVPVLKLERKEREISRPDVNISDACFQCIEEAAGCVGNTGVDFRGSLDESVTCPYGLSRKYWENSGFTTTDSELNDFEKCTVIESCAKQVVSSYVSKFLKGDCNDDGRLDCTDVGLVHLAKGGACTNDALRQSDQWKTFNECVQVTKPKDLIDISKSHKKSNDRGTVIGTVGSKIILISQDQYPFNLAERFCQAVSATQLVITSQAENDMVVNYLKQRDLGDTWLGGTREGFPHTSDGSNFYWVQNVRFINRAGAYTNWYPGTRHAKQPDNFGNKDEKCLGMYKTFEYFWDDDLCGNHRLVLCQITM